MAAFIGPHIFIVLYWPFEWPLALSWPLLSTCHSLSDYLITTLQYAHTLYIVCRIKLWIYFLLHCIALFLTIIKYYPTVQCTYV